ncbi:hypothetical protein HMPREF1556_00558 [Porphyromonas sp. oral taxon 278 str. W7784]|nr:hypothetical protein HMPREF1556_00558 [Porphyromonas sp. oral taxon 278 str. W7784]
MGAVVGTAGIGDGVAKLGDELVPEAKPQRRVSLDQLVEA